MSIYPNGFDRAQRDYDTMTDDQPDGAACDGDDGGDDYPAPERIPAVLTTAQIDAAFAKARQAYIQQQRAG